MEHTAPIVEVFRSLEGEGFEIGTPTIFVRLAGCNVGCRHCDSKTTWSANAYRSCTVGEVFDTIEGLQTHGLTIKRISITGGEPLLHQDFVQELAAELNKSGYTLNLETSGTIFPEWLFNPKLPTLFNSISMDIKTPSSGVKLSDEQIHCLRSVVGNPNVYTKAVAGGVEDVNFIMDHFYVFNHQFNHLVFTPCEVDGAFFSVADIIAAIDEYGPEYEKFKFQIIAQQHKLLGFS